MPVRTGYPKRNLHSGAKTSQEGYKLFASYSNVATRSDAGQKRMTPIPAGQISADAIVRPILWRRLRGMLAAVRADSASKLNDGLIPAIVLILLTVLYDLIQVPVAQAFKLPGMLVFILSLLSLGAISLDRSLQQRYSQTERVFQGMLAGMFFWFTANAAARLEMSETGLQSNILYMLLAAMIVVALWRTVLPVGAKFFSLVFLLNWVGRFLFNRQLMIFRNWGFLAEVQWIYAWIALTCVLLLVVWLFLGSRRQIHRSWAAVGVWFCTMQALTLFLGWAL